MTQPCAPTAAPPVIVPITRVVAEVLGYRATDLPTWLSLPEPARDHLLEALRIV